MYGFISVPGEIQFDLIEHPWFQRLRRIKQLGLTYLVYPGAYHTRFQHALGAMHLMGQAIEVLRQKGQAIGVDEENGLLNAILLHDIGHGPFSHALESSITEAMSHEDISLLCIDRMNVAMNGRLDMARNIFAGDDSGKFLRQLVSSQLDVDRLDYLKRDSFFTGVSEGVISADRIIKMMNVVNNELAVEVKGIYSVEKFIVARRLMYWQVYLHKTVLAAEHLLIRILRRARELALQGQSLFSTPSLSVFLSGQISAYDFIEDPSILEHFMAIDDYDIFTSLKVWCSHPDPVLARLCRNMVDRHLFHIEIESEAFSAGRIDHLRQKVAQAYGISTQEAGYFVFTGEVANSAYDPRFDKINILYRDGLVTDITEASDQLNIDLLARTIKKYFLCCPKDIDFRPKI